MAMVKVVNDIGCAPISGTHGGRNNNVGADLRLESGSNVNHSVLFLFFFSIRQ